MSMAKVVLYGNVGRMPEKRFTPNGHAVTTFSVAVNRKEKGKEDVIVDWYRVNCWGDMAETVANTISKGSKVKVEGRLQQREYEAKDGTKKISIEITADSVELDDKFSKQEQVTNSDDNIPF